MLVAGAQGAITASGVRTWYLTLSEPPGTPPNWVFPPVWWALYVLIGTSGWLIWRRTGAGRAVRLWGWQLLVNALWGPAFFGMHSVTAGLVIILVMLSLIVMTVRVFAQIRPLAAYLLLPYLAWSTYATYLNLGFWWLNAA